MKFSKMMYGLVFVFLCTVSVFAENGTETVPGIEGSYSDPDNNPLGYARVSLYDGSLARVRSMITAADGSFRFSGLQPGPYYLEFTMPGAPNVWYGGPDKSAITVGASIVCIAFRYPESPGIAGRYLGRDGGAMGVTQVRLYDSRKRRIEVMRSAADGSFRFSGLQPGAYYLEFSRSEGHSFWYGGATMSAIIVGSAMVSVECRDAK